jgi:hypothetical protein
MLKNLWLDEGGALLSVELILLMVITVIGISVGLVVLRDAVVSELQIVASAVNSIDPGYAWGSLEYVGVTSGAFVNGSAFDSGAINVGVGFGQIKDTVNGTAPVIGSMLPPLITSP